MSIIKPIDGYLVNAERVEQIVSPAYDALTPQQRHEFATTHPQNYLNVMRSREEFSDAERPSLTQLLEGNRARLKQMMDKSDFIYQGEPRLFIYRLRYRDHVQTGVVAEISISEYEQGLVKKHEHTQEEKEDDLTAYLHEVRASSSPICLTYLPDTEIDDFVATLTARDPEIRFSDSDGLVQSVWGIGDPDEIAELVRLFQRVPASYLTDGHHRAASASRFRAAERDANENHTGDEPYNDLLVAFFPADQLRILEYNRWITGLVRQRIPELLEGLGGGFEVERLEVVEGEDARPRKPREMAMYLDGRWYRLNVRSSVGPRADPVSALDVSLLQDRLLGPVLGIVDPRTDPRIGYLSGAFDMNQLQAHCRQHQAIGFAVFPTAIEDLMAVADAGAVMPPKSTWFDPKLRSGLFLRMR